MRRATRIQTVTTTNSPSETEPPRTEGVRTNPRAPDDNACTQRSRHALRCFLRIVPSGRRSGSETD
jgi:hypothetical protein